MPIIIMSWKGIAILFIILFITETLAFGFLLYVGVAMVGRENECRFNVCMDYDAFIYDDYEQLCYCYEDDELAHQEYIR